MMMKMSHFAFSYVQVSHRGCVGGGFFRLFRCTAGDDDDNDDVVDHEGRRRQRDDVVFYRLTIMRKDDQQTFICTKRYR